jgi:hypothetical protein
MAIVGGRGGRDRTRKVCGGGGGAHLVASMIFFVTYLTLSIA